MESGSYSVAFPRRWWYPMARSSELRRRPLAVMLMDTPLVVFRGAAQSDEDFDARLNDSIASIFEASIT